MELSSYDIAKFLNDCTDEEYAEAFVLLDIMKHGDINEGLSKENMREACIDRITSDISNALHEIIDEDSECDESAWWKDRYLYYMVDVDMYAEDYGVVETIESDLFRSRSLKEALKFAKKYAKDKSHFDFKYLDKEECDYYEMTIRKYYSEGTDTENAEYDDYDGIIVSKPRKKRA